MKKVALAMAAILSLCMASVALAGQPGEKCEYGGKTYSEGSRTCQEGRVKECFKGEWHDIGERCGGGNRGGSSDGGGNRGNGGNRSGESGAANRR